MKIKAKIFYRALSLCLALVMLMGALPVLATEADGTEQTGDEASTEKQVVRVTKDVPRGTKLTEKMLEIETVGANIPVPSNAYSTIEEAVDKYAKINIYVGEYIYKEQLSSTSVGNASEDVLLKSISKVPTEYVVVTDYVKPNTDEDLSYYLQELIDTNDGRTIYFPDGVYTIAYPLETASDPKRSVSIQLADGAVIKASHNWRGVTGVEKGDGLIHLGALTPTANDINSVGSYYTLIGGTLDCNNRANGVVIDGGRESVIRNICIKNAKTGILVNDGANSGSSDIDFEDITIIGNGMTGTTGVKIIGNDNSFTNIRIYNMEKGFYSQSGGNLMKSIYVINTNEKLINSGRTRGIEGNGWYSQCYVENCDAAFVLWGSAIVSDATAVWNVGRQIQKAYRLSNTATMLSGCRAYFCDAEGGEYRFIDSGNAYLEAVIVDKSFNAVGLEGKDSVTVPLG